MSYFDVESNAPTFIKAKNVRPTMTVLLLVTLNMGITIAFVLLFLCSELMVKAEENQLGDIRYGIGPSEKDLVTYVLEQEWMNQTLDDVSNTLLSLSDQVKALQTQLEQVKSSSETCKEDQFHMMTTFNAFLQEINNKEERRGRTLPVQSNPIPPTPDECGSIHIGKSGFVFYKAREAPLLRRFTCTWTIRSDTYEKIALKLVSDNLVGSVSSVLYVPLLSISNPLEHTKESISRPQVFITPGDRNTYEFEGPIAFITLITDGNVDPNYLPSFTLYYEGRGNATKYADRKFNHYHYTDTKGLVTYPYRQNYEDNEWVTFVINPMIAHPGNFYMKILDMDIEDCDLCSCDYIRTFDAHKTKPKYTYWGTDSKDFKNCGKYNVKTTGTKESERWFVVFESNGNKTGTGFSLSWDNKWDATG